MPTVAGGVDQTSFRVRWGQETRENRFCLASRVPHLLPTTHPIASRVPETRMTVHFLAAMTVVPSFLALRSCWKDPWSDPIAR